MCAVLEKNKTKKQTLNRYSLGKEKEIEFLIHKQFKSNQVYFHS